MNFAQLKVVMQSAQDEIREAAADTPYKYSMPLVIIAMTDIGIGVTVCIGGLERKSDKLQSFDEAVVEIQLMTRWIIAQFNGDALARTLGVEMAHA